MKTELNGLPTFTTRDLGQLLSFKRARIKAIKWGSRNGHAEGTFVDDEKLQAVITDYMNKEPIPYPVTDMLNDLRDLKALGANGHPR